MAYHNNGKPDDIYRRGENRNRLVKGKKIGFMFSRLKSRGFRRMVKITFVRILRSFNLSFSRLFPRPFEELGVRGRDLIGVEIGVDKGEHAKSLLENLSIKKLYLIEPYTEYDGFKYKGNFYGLYKNPTNRREKIARRKLSKYSDKIIWVKKKSADAIKDIPDNLDFVYIDGNHDYKFVKEDIEKYYPKVKEGGIIGGHDYYNAGEQENLGIVKAVTEFISKVKPKFYVSSPDWWIVKKIKIPYSKKVAKKHR